jgi:hypothetical protein
MRPFRRSQKKLKSLHEHLSTVQADILPVSTVPSGIACPVCGEEMLSKVHRFYDIPREFYETTCPTSAGHFDQFVPYEAPVTYSVEVKDGQTV